MSGVLVSLLTATDCNSKKAPKASRFIPLAPPTQNNTQTTGCAPTCGVIARLVVVRHDGFLNCFE